MHDCFSGISAVILGMDKWWNTAEGIDRVRKEEKDKLVRLARLRLAVKLASVPKVLERLRDDALIPATDRSWFIGNPKRGGW